MVDSAGLLEEQVEMTFYTTGISDSFHPEVKHENVIVHVVGVPQPGNGPGLDCHVVIGLYPLKVSVAYRGRFHLEAWLPRPAVINIDLPAACSGGASGGRLHLLGPDEALLANYSPVLVPVDVTVTRPGQPGPVGQSQGLDAVLDFPARTKWYRNKEAHKQGYGSTRYQNPCYRHLSSFPFIPRRVP